MDEKEGAEEKFEGAARFPTGDTEVGATPEPDDDMMFVRMLEGEGLICFFAIGDCFSGDGTSGCALFGERGDDPLLGLATLRASAG